MFNPQPKPEPRGPKARIALRRVTPLRVAYYSPKDPAAFTQKAVAALWTPHPYCIITMQRPCDLHHILGRGELFGVRPGDSNRVFFSSPFNCAPICIEIHKGPKRDNVHMRKLFLEDARMRIFNAVGAEQYVLTDNDRSFLQIADQWLSSIP